MKKPNKLLLLIPVSLLVIFIFFFSVQKYSKPICGNGICENSEIEEGSSLCDIDCKEQCISSTGSTIDNIEDECSVGWGGTYINLAEKDIIDQDYLKETDIFDFSNPEIQGLAKSLKKDTIKETVKATARWTFENIRYDSGSVYYDCRNVKASEILQRKVGVCSTMSKLNIALLRANGIPAYSVTGCWKFNAGCKLVQTFYSSLLKRFIEINVDESGYAPTLGYLHNWVIVPLYQDNETENVILESTTGTLYENKCVNYKAYYEAPKDSLACGLTDFDSNLNDCRLW